MIAKKQKNTSKSEELEFKKKLYYNINNSSQIK